MTGSAPVLLEHRHDAVLHLTLNRPSKRNALTAELRARLIDELNAAARDPTVIAVLITGAGDHFCAGFGLHELQSVGDPATVFEEATRYHRTVYTFPNRSSRPSQARPWLAVSI